MNFAHNSCIISTEYVRDADIVIDCNNSDAFRRAHIPGAKHLGHHPYLKISTKQPTVVLDPKRFEALCSKLGVHAYSKISVYDDKDGVLAGRAWWVFTYYGHKNVRMVDGGWQKWAMEKRPFEADMKKTTSSAIKRKDEVAAKGSFVPRANPNMIISAEDLRSKIGRIQIWDTRNRAEFEGTMMRKNPRQGAIPGAMHLMWADLIDDRTHCLLPQEEIIAKLRAVGLNPNYPMVTHCQSGIRSAHSALVAAYIGAQSVQNYDGSMGEWSRLSPSKFPLANQRAKL